MERAAFSSFDGLVISYLLAGEEEASSAVLLHHGFASTAEINWVRPGIVQALAEAGRRVVALDARGHGHSEHPHEVARYSGGAMARDVEALIDHLGLEAVDIAGYSMGAFVTMAVATRDQRVRSAFLGGVGLGQIELRESGKTRRIAEALETDDPGSISDRSARAFRSFADATGQDRLALAAIQRADSFGEGGVASRLSLPTLVVNGKDDTLAGDPAALAARIEKARSEVVPGDHMSAVTKEGFRALLVEWETQW
jgi:pimeloyl-ACP methyl ester carboxylesterase